MLPRECLGFSDPFILGNESSPGFSSNHHKRKGLCLKGRCPQELIPWWVSEEGEPPQVWESHGREAARSLAPEIKSKLSWFLIMLRSLGQVHQLRVQGTKFFVFLWENVSSCYNFLIICPCGPVHHQEEISTRNK